MFVPPKEEETNKNPGDAGHFIRTEIDSTDFKKENLVSKVCFRENRMFLKKKRKMCQKIMKLMKP